MRTIIRVLIIEIVCHVSVLFAENPSKTIVSGTVSVLLDSPERVNAAKVSFRDTDGQIVQVTTNKIGEYAASLTAQRDYTVTIEGASICPMHRPAFQTKSGTQLRFDFVTTICGTIDSIRIGPHTPQSDNFRHYYHTPTPHWFFEESLPLENDDRRLIIAFGSQEQGNDTIIYGPFHVPGYGGILPVTVSFGTYTIQGEKAMLNQENKTLKVIGNVTTEDGSAIPARVDECEVITLKDEPHFQTCP